MKGSTSQLVSALAAWNHFESVPTNGDWVDQLSRWVGPVDAMALSAANQSIQATGLNPPFAKTQVRPTNLDEAFRRTRADLLKALEPAQGARPLDRRNGAPRKTATAADAEPDFASYRQRYAEVQRRMEWRIEPLRSHCRQVLSQTSAQLRQLAELDIAMEHLLGERQRVLLTKLPPILEIRFESLKREYQRSNCTPTSASTVGPAETTNPTHASASNRNAAPWWEDFERDFECDFESMVRGEIDLRMQPIAGLIEAFNEIQGQL